jgi:hypothetical protein
MGRRALRDEGYRADFGLPIIVNDRRLCEFADYWYKAMGAISGTMRPSARFSTMSLLVDPCLLRPRSEMVAKRVHVR